MTPGSPPRIASDQTPVLLYDGDCGLCHRVVQFILSWERPGRGPRAAGTPAPLQFAALTGTTGLAVRVAFPELNAVDSAVWYDPARATVLVRSDAVLAILRYLGGAWGALGWCFARLPRALRDALYDEVARSRHRIPERMWADPARHLTPADAHRFLD